MKHSPQIELAAARRALDSAREACPHWDNYGDHGDHGDPQDCCYAVDDARRRLQAARKRVA